MSVVLKREEIARLGGQYRPTPQKVGAIEKPAPPPQVVAPQSVPPVIIHHHTDSSTSEMSNQLAQILKGLPKSGGTWMATVTSRDEYGRILTLEFKQQE